MLDWCEKYIIRQVDLRTLQTSRFCGSTAGYREGVGTNAAFSALTGIGLDYGRNIMYAIDSADNRLRAIDMATLQTSTLAGTGVQGFSDGGPLKCQFGCLKSIVVQQTTGNIFVTADECYNNIRMVTPEGQCSTLAGAQTLPSAGSTDGVGLNARFSGPLALAFDLAGILYVADSSYFAVARAISPQRQYRIASANKHSWSPTCNMRPSFHALTNLTGKSAPLVNRSLQAITTRSAESTSRPGR